MNIGKQMPHEKRAPENGERLIRAHALVVDVLDALLVAETDALDAAIEAALAEIGSFAAVDRAYVFVARQDQAAFDNTHEWVADGIAPMIDELQGQPADLFAPLHDAFLRGEEVQIPDVTRLEDDNPLKPELEMQEIRSVLAVPMLDEGSVFGFVGFDAVRAPRVFLDEEVRLLKSVARLVGVRLKRRRAELSAAQAQMQEREARDRLEATLNVLPGLILELDAAGRAKYVAEMAKKRADLQAKIRNLSAARDKYVATERARLAAEAPEDAAAAAAPLADAVIEAVQNQTGP